MFDTLGSLFDGCHHTKHEEGAPERPCVVHPKDPAAARALYFLYLKRYPNLWSHVVQAAETLALKEAAVAANSLISTFVNADWEVIDDDSFANCGDEPEYYIRTEQQLADLCGGPLAPTPPIALLSGPALQSVIPYLLKPAQTSTNLGIGGKGDVIKVVNNIAAIRFEALSNLHQKLSEHSRMPGSESAWGDILAQVKKRLDQGRWGGVSGGMYFPFLALGS